ncbi:MAG: zinc ribbon domain-containing protein [Chloroflexota bacterium]
MAKCANCGANVSEKDVFCGECGARLSTSPATPTELPIDTLEVIEAPAVAATAPVAPRRGALWIVVGILAAAIVIGICGCVALLVITLSCDKQELAFQVGTQPPPTRPIRSGVPAAAPILEETFGSNSREWSVWQDEHGEKGVEDGVYFVLVDDTEWASWGTSEQLFFDDFDLEVDAQAVAGSDNNGYGVVFRYQDNDHFYYFEVSSDGYYSIGKQLDGEWVILVDWRESDLIHPGKQNNRLQVTCQGSQMTFAVNGYLLEQLTDSEFVSGNVGFMVEAAGEPGVRVHFDNLKVWAVE